MHMLLALVAKAAGHGDFGTCGPVPRTRKIAVLDFLPHHDVETQLCRSCGVTGSEAVVENERRVAAGAKEVLLGRDLSEVLVARRSNEREVAMALDQTGHQRHA